jgi:hypothetical protein
LVELFFYLKNNNNNNKVKDMAFLEIAVKDNSTALTPAEFNYLVSKLNNRKLKDLIDVQSSDALDGDSIRHNGSGWVFHNIMDEHYSKTEINALFGVSGISQIPTLTVDWGGVNGTIRDQTDLVLNFGDLKADNNIWLGNHFAKNYILDGSSISSTIESRMEYFTVTDGITQGDIDDKATLKISGNGVTYVDLDKEFIIDVPSIDDITDFTDNSSVWDALVTFPGFSTLSADYGYTEPIHAIDDITDFTDNSSDWDESFAWGDHSGLYSLSSHTHAFASLTSKPTTIGGYGITDFVSLGNAEWMQIGDEPTNHTHLIADITDFVDNSDVWDALVSDIPDNVSTNLSLGAITGITMDVNSSDGTNVTLVEANTSQAGLLGSDKWDEIVINSLKVSNIEQTSIVGITGTKAHFNTSLTDGTFVYASDLISVAYIDDVNTKLHKSIYNATLGILIKTNITGATDMFTLDVKGNGYTGNNSFDINTQGYAYNSGLLNGVNGVSINYTETVYHFFLDGFLHIWLTQPSLYSTLNCFVNDSTGSGNNRITTITNVAKPATGVTSEVALVCSNVATTNLNNGFTVRQDINVNVEALRFNTTAATGSSYISWFDTAIKGFFGFASQSDDDIYLVNSESGNIRLGTSGRLADFYINSTGHGTFANSVTASSFIKSGGSGLNILLDDGTVSLFSNVLKTNVEQTITSKKTFDTGADGGLTVKVIDGVSAALRFKNPSTMGANSTIGYFRTLDTINGASTEAFSVSVNTGTQAIGTVSNPTPELIMKQNNRNNVWISGGLSSEVSSQINSRLQLGYSNYLPDQSNTNTLDVNGNIVSQQTIAQVDAGVAKTVPTKEWVEAQNVLGYEVYSALISQVSTGAPTAIVLNNTLGGAVTFTRVSTGNYTINLSGAFTTDKTQVFFGNTLTYTICSSQVTTTSLIDLTTASSLTNSGADGLINKTSIEIRVYP